MTTMSEMTSFTDDPFFGDWDVLSSTFLSIDDHSDHGAAQIKKLDQAGLVIKDSLVVEGVPKLTIEPKLICPFGPVTIVPNLSVQDDVDLCSSNISGDFIMALLSEESNCGAPLSVPSLSALSDFFKDLTTKKQPKRAGPNDSSPAQSFNGDDDAAETNRGPTRGRALLRKWDLRFKELVDFKDAVGHCNVPNVFPANPKLAQWVKRQRYQHKPKIQGKPSALTENRQRVLEDIGFVWDSHETSWTERWTELQSFRAEHGHSNVPASYHAHRKLSAWVKCQRRQFRLYNQGYPSNMSPERLRKLQALEFVFNPRNLNLK
jgi:hypothetical protein